MERLIKKLLEAIDNLLTDLNMDGTCLVCEGNFFFHKVECPVHDVNIAWSNLVEALNDESYQQPHES